MLLVFDVIRGYVKFYGSAFFVSNQLPISVSAWYFRISDKQIRQKKYVTYRLIWETDSFN